MENRPVNPQPSVVGMEKPSSSSASTAILWITFVVALGVTLFLFMAGKSAANAVTEREAEKQDLVSTLASPEYAAVEEKAQSFSQAFTILSELISTRKPKKDVMTELYANFTKDVRIKNLALSSDGAITIDGVTSSYRSTADFMTGLKNYSKISNLQLTTVGLTTVEDAPASERIIFSIKGVLDTKKAVTTTSDSSSISSPSTSVGL